MPAINRTVWDMRISSLSEVTTTVTPRTSPGTFAAMGYGSANASWEAVLENVDDAAFMGLISRLQRVAMVTDTTTLFDVAHCRIDSLQRSAGYVEECLKFTDGEFSLYAAVRFARSVELQRELVHQLSLANNLTKRMSSDDAVGLVAAIYRPTGMSGEDLPTYAADVIAQLGLKRCMEAFS